MLTQQIREHPRRPAVSDGRTRRSFGELGERAGAWAQWLQGRGLTPGAHLGLLCGNRTEYVEVVLGGLWAGLWVVPLNWHLTAPELGGLIDCADLRLLLVEAGLVERFDRRQLGGVEWVELESVVLPAARSALPDPQRAAGGVMMFTGGTSGLPRGVKRAQPATLGEQLQSQAAAGRELGLDGGGPHLLSGPMYHAAPFLFALYDLYNGASVHIQRHFDALETLQAIQALAIAHTHCVPTQFVRFLRLPEAQRRGLDLSSLSLLLHGAAPVSQAVKRAMIDWLGPVLVEYWGGTESGVVTRCDSAQWLAHPGSVGRALPHLEVLAVDGGGAELPPGEEGLLYVRNARLARPFSYFGDPAATAEAYLAPGVFTLGDTGRVDDEGYVSIAARRSNLIIRGGVNVYPAEVEAALLEHPLVEDAVVFGLDDPEWGSTVNALVAAAEGRVGELSPPALAAFLAERLAGFKRPRVIRVVARIDRKPTGKVSLAAVRAQFHAVGGSVP